MRRPLAAVAAAAVLATGATGCFANATRNRAGAGAGAGNVDSGRPQAASSTAKLVAAAALAPCPQPPGSASSAPTPAGGLPPMTLGCLGGGPPVVLSGLRGPAVVNLWASWCQPCRQEMPRLQALHALAGERLLVLGVATDDDRRDALSAAAALGVHYASLIDAEGSLRRSFGYPGPPITLLIGRDGAVVQRIVGPVPPLAELRRTVSSRLGVGL